MLLEVEGVKSVQKGLLGAHKFQCSSAMTLNDERSDRDDRCYMRDAPTGAVDVSDHTSKP